MGLYNKDWQLSCSKESTIYSAYYTYPRTGPARVLWYSEYVTKHLYVKCNRPTTEKLFDSLSYLIFFSTHCCIYELISTNFHTCMSDQNYTPITISTEMIPAGVVIISVKVKRYLSGSVTESLKAWIGMKLLFVFFWLRKQMFYMYTVVASINFCLATWI